MGSELFRVRGLHVPFLFTENVQRHYYHVSTLITHVDCVCPVSVPVFGRGVLAGPQEHPFFIGPGQLCPPCPAGRLETGPALQRIHLLPPRS